MQPSQEGFRFTAAFASIAGHAPALRQVLERAARVAPTRLPALVLGESGTGKELLARALHDLGPNPAGPLVTVNCGALPRELAESELFGHERGAFTGAQTVRAGWFEAASGGTLVLDEIGELPIDLQPKLLRVLETGRYFRVGGRAEVVTQARVVAMTNRDLGARARAGTFRLDLYHRLAGVELRLPPLRERRGDIPVLVARFVAELRAEMNEGDDPAGSDASTAIGPGALDALADADLSGNVRQLRNLVRRTAIVHGLPLTRETLRAELGDMPAEVGRAAENHDPAAWGATGAAPPCPARAPVPAPENDQVLSLPGKTWDQIERVSFSFALRCSGGSRRAAARALGISRSTFCDRVKRLGLVRDQVGAGLPGDVEAPGDRGRRAGRVVRGD